MSTKSEQTKAPKSIEDMFSVGAHFGFIKSRRHPSFKPLIFGTKNWVEIIDLEKTDEYLNKAIEFAKLLGSQGKQILLVSSKSEAKESIKDTAVSVDMPYVAGRWVGGTLTNFDQIKKRVARLEDLISKKEKNELLKYTKKERLLIDREIERLNDYFSGLRSMHNLPGALFVVDSKKESIAVTEARKMKIPVIALSSSDCDLSKVDFPIPANDVSKLSIKYFVEKIVDAFEEGRKTKTA